MGTVENLQGDKNKKAIKTLHAKKLKRVNVQFCHKEVLKLLIFSVSEPALKTISDLE